MRKLLTLSAFLFCSINLLQAQFLKKEIPGGKAFSQSLSTVVEHFQNNYHQIQGEMLPSDPDRDIFLSTVMVQGASKCLIYRFHSKEDSSASWQALLYSGEDFDVASKIYKQAFRQTRQTKFKIGLENYSFEGSLLAPTEDLRFTSSILRPTYDVGQYKNFVAEIEMINTVEGWTVQLNLHSRKADTERFD